MANAKRGRPRKPTAMLKLTGQYREDRHGAGEPQPKGMPRRPDDLSPIAAEFWEATVPELVTLGLASAVDTPHLIALAEWWADYETARRGDDVASVGLQDVAKAIDGLAAVLKRKRSDAWAEAADKALDVFARITDEQRAARDRMTRKQQAWQEFTRIAAKFGLTPADRRGLAGQEKKPDNPFAVLMAKRQAR